MSVKQYRKRPVVIEAFLWDGKSIEELDTFMGEQKHDYTTEPKGRNGGYLVNIKTLEGVMTANIGDYIIKGVQGEFYPCKPDIFEATYEATDDKR